MPRIARHDSLCRSGDALQTVAIDGKVELASGAAPLHLDEAYNAAAPGYQIDLAAPGFDASAQDTPPGQPQVPGGKRLAPAPSPLGFFSAPAHFSSSARA